MAEFMSPNGGDIQGTSEVILGAAEVTFSEDGSYEHGGHTEMFWDTSETDSIDGVPMFTDDGGEDWLQHHLLPQRIEILGEEDEEVEVEGMDSDQIAVLRRELAIGRALEAALKLAQHKNVLTNAQADDLTATVIDLKQRYREAKQRSIALVEAHLEQYEKEEA
jgi:hypothetical protein